MVKAFNIFFLVTFLTVFAASIADAQQVGVTKSNLDQNADQSQGNYATTNLNYLGGIGSLGMMQDAWKDPLQHMGEGQTKPGYSKYYWTPELVLPVRVREGMYTLINFPNWEVIENVFIGDGQSFSAEIQGPSSLMVYPEVAQFVGVDTNMVVFGRSGNKYVFYLQSETVNTDRITNAIIDIEVVKNKKDKRKNQDGSLGYGASSNGNSGYADGSEGDAYSYTRNLQKEDWIERIPVDPTKFRFDIEVYVPNPDDIIIAPERVWRDNIFTYIDLGEKALSAVQRPIVTLIVERSETPVGFRAAGPNNRLIIVEGMGDMVLRSGKRIVCLKLRRADSDGLENTIYAKTNDWDLQTAHASQPTDLEDGDGLYEDVYGSGSGSNHTSKTKEDSQGFFTGNIFSTPNKSENIDVFDSIEQQQNEIKGTQEKQNKENTAKESSFKLDELPKTAPIVAPTIKNQEPQVTKQFDVKINDAEIVTPEYNNEKDVIKLSYTSNQSKPESEQPVKQGNQDIVSANNSNPVLIAPKENILASNTVVSEETEALLKEFRNKDRFSVTDESNISIELGTDENVNNLEKLWNEISKRYSATIGHYQPFYSVDTPADGQGKEVFHLRVGPVNSIDDGDNICSQLGRNGIFCSVVRVQ